MTRMAWLSACTAIGLLLPGAARAQGSGPPIEVGGLLRTGFRIEPASSSESDGFDIFDARLRFSGEVGIVFDYFVQIQYDPDDDAFELLDAKATVPVFPELDLAFGLFRPPFGYEALVPKGDLTFVDRAEAVRAVAPGRQVGVEVGGEAFEGRFTYGAGLFNGNGRALENDGDDYLFSARAQYNSIGSIAFYDDLVVQVGGSIARASDTAAPLGPGNGPLETDLAVPELSSGGFAGERTLWGVDAQVTLRGWALTAELLGADYDFAAPVAVPTADGTIESIEDASTTGGYVELGYRAWGAIETVARYDAIDPAAGSSRDFLVLGLNVYPGYYAKFAIQYAVPLDDSPNGSAIRRNQFLFTAQIDF
ncbi:MAG: porin [Gemmatimonadota bacterium]|nr:porin [Gemmatimonadota bacterium]